MLTLPPYGALGTANPIPEDLIRNLVHVANFLGVEDEQILLPHLERMQFTMTLSAAAKCDAGWAQFGFRYSSTGRKLEPCTPFPDFIEELKEKVQPFPLCRNASKSVHYHALRAGRWNRLAYRCAGFRRLRHRHQPRWTRQS